MINHVLMKLRRIGTLIQLLELCRKEIGYLMLWDFLILYKPRYPALLGAFRKRIFNSKTGRSALRLLAPTGGFCHATTNFR